MGAWYGPGPSMKPAAITRGPISTPESKRLRRASSSSVSFARSRTVVTPAAMLSRPSSSLTCVCMSQRPGSSVPPPPSIRSAPAPAVSDVATEAMRFPWTVTTRLRSTFPVSESKTLTLWKTRSEAGLREIRFARPVRHWMLDSSCATASSSSDFSHPSRMNMSQRPPLAKRFPSRSSHT